MMATHLIFSDAKGNELWVGVFCSMYPVDEQLALLTPLQPSPLPLPPSVYTQILYMTIGSVKRKSASESHGCPLRVECKVGHIAAALTG